MTVRGVAMIYTVLGDTGFLSLELLNWVDVSLSLPSALVLKHRKILTVELRPSRTRRIGTWRRMQKDDTKEIRNK